MPRKKKTKDQKKEKERSIGWALIKGCKIKWPVQVLENTPSGVLVYIKSDDKKMYATAIENFEENFEVNKNFAENFCKKKKLVQTIQCFKKDLEWVQTGHTDGIDKPYSTPCSTDCRDTTSDSLPVNGREDTKSDSVPINSRESTSSDSFPIKGREDTNSDPLPINGRGDTNSDPLPVNGREDTNSDLLHIKGREDTNSDPLPVNDIEDTNSDSLHIKGREDTNSDSLPINGREDTSSDSLPMKDREDTNSDSLPINGREDTNSDSLPVTDREDTNSDSLPINGREDTSSDSLPIKGREDTNSDPLPVKDREDTNSDSLPIKDRQDTSSDSLPVNGREDTNSDSLPIKGREDTNSDPLPVKDREDTNSDSLPIKGREDTNSDPLPINGRGDTNSDPLPINGRGDTNSDPLPVNGREDTNSDPLPVKDREDTNSDSLPVNGREDTNSDSLPVKDREDTNSDSLPIKDREDTNSDSLPIKGREDTSSDSLPVNGREDTNSDSLPVKDREDTNSDPLPINGREDTNSDSLPVKDREDTNSDSLPIKGREDTNSDPLPVNGREDTNSDLLPVISREDTNSDLLPVISREDTNSDPLPVISREDTNSDPLPVISREDINSDSFPIKGREDTNSDSLPIKGREDTNSDPLPVKDREDTNSDLLPVISREDTNSDLLPVISREDTNSDTLPINGREDTNSDSLPINGREDTNSDPLPIDGREDTNSDLLPVNGREDTNSDLLPVNGREDTNSDSLHIKGREDTNSDSLPINGREDTNSDLLPVNGREDTNSDPLPVNGREDTNSDSLHIKGREDTNSDSLHIKGREDTNSDSLPTKGREDTNSDLLHIKGREDTNFISCSINGREDTNSVEDTNLDITGSYILRPLYEMTFTGQDLSNCFEDITTVTTGSDGQGPLKDMTDATYIAELVDSADDQDIIDSIGDPDYIYDSEDADSDASDIIPTIKSLPLNKNIFLSERSQGRHAHEETISEFEQTSDIDEPKECKLQPTSSEREIDVEDCIFDEKNPKIFIKRKKENKKSKIQRDYDIVHECLYCYKSFSNIYVHFENKHFKEKEVKEILTLKDDLKKSTNDVQRKLLEKQILAKKTLLRNKGDDAHNTNVMKNGSGEIYVRRRKSSFHLSEYGACENCHEWLLLDNLTKHQKNCLGKTEEVVWNKGAAIIRSKIKNGLICPEGSKLLHKEVLPKMWKDDVYDVAVLDPLIMSLGDIWFMKNIDNKLKRANLASFRMRLAARLLIILRKETGERLSFAEFLKPKHFDSIVKCSLKACGEELDESLQHPSTAIKLGFDISRLITSKMGYCIKKGDNTGMQECLNLEKLIENEWSYRVSKLANTILNERKFNKKSKLPYPEDIATLSTYLMKEIQILKEKTHQEVDVGVVFRTAVKLSQARLLLFNKRRPGELESMSIKNYKERSTQVDEVDLSLRTQFTKLEKEILSSHHLVEIRGKCGKGVPVIIPEDTIPLMEFISNKENREKAGVNKDNIYIFANSALSVIRAGNSLDEIKHSCSLKAAERITATNLRKYTATISQVIGLKDNQVEWLCKHLGHTVDVHKAYYKSTSGMIERMEIAKLMVMQERNQVGKFAGRDLSKVTFDEIIDEDQEDDDDAEDQEDDDDASSDNTVQHAKKRKEEDHTDEAPMAKKNHNVQYAAKINLLEEDETPVPRKKHKVERNPWSKQEEEEINKYLGTCIKNKKCPGKSECIAAIVAVSQPTQVSLTNGKPSDIHTSVAAEETVDTLTPQAHHIMIIHEDATSSTYTTQVISSEDINLEDEKERAEDQNTDNQIEDMEQKYKKLQMEKIMVEQTLKAEISDLQSQVNELKNELADYQKREQEYLDQLSVPLDKNIENVLKQMENQHRSLLHQHLLNLKRQYKPVPIIMNGLSSDSSQYLNQNNLTELSQDVSPTNSNMAALSQDDGTSSDNIGVLTQNVSSATSICSSSDSVSTSNLDMPTSISLEENLADRLCQPSEAGDMDNAVELKDKADKMNFVKSSNGDPFVVCIQYQDSMDPKNSVMVEMHGENGDIIDEPMLKRLKTS